METKDYEALHDLIQGAQAEFHEFALDLRKLRQSFGTNNSTAKISINAGGWGVWVAATACVITMVVAVVSSVLSNQNVTTAFIASGNQIAELKADLRDAKAYNTLHESRIKKLEINNEHSNNH